MPRATPHPNPWTMVVVEGDVAARVNAVSHKYADLAAASCGIMLFPQPLFAFMVGLLVSHQRAHQRDGGVVNG